jgi:hypothetical protein
MEINEFHKVIEAITNIFEKEVSKEIRDIVDKNTIQKNTYQSEKINELAKAFSKAQSEYSSVIYNRENPYFKSQYADLHAILKAVRPALAANGLSFYQYTEISDGTGATILHSRLLHQSGQWIETKSRLIPAKNDQQTYGSTLTYQKRYAAMTLLGITASNDIIDDDAEIAMATAKNIIAKGPTNKYNPKEQSHATITKEQLEELEYELVECPDIAEDILDKMHLQSLADLPKSKFLVSIKRVREIKRLRNEGK